MRKYEFISVVRPKSIGMQESQHLNSMYRELNAKIERFTQLFHLIIMKISTPLFLLPPLIMSLTNYYISGLGVESFELPIPTM